MRLVSIVGARPNFIKLAPVAREAADRRLDHRIINSNQHSDDEMNRRFFKALSLPEPDFICKAFNGSPAARFGRMIETIGVGLNTIKPDVVLVYGDVATTAAGAIAARLLNLPVAHYGAGVRSGDDNMPEEFNRKLVDSVSDLLLTPHESCKSNLIAEGVSERKIFNVGNLLVDAAKLFNERFAADQSYGGPYALVTLHRPETVDDPDRFIAIFEAISEGCEGLDIVFPIHPRTEQLVNEHRLNLRQVHKSGQFRAIPPQGYFQIMGLQKGADLIVTDSAGLREEALILGRPCLTVRENSEWPLDLNFNSNLISGHNPNKIVEMAKHLRALDIQPDPLPENWDGKAAERILDALTGF